MNVDDYIRVNATPSLGLRATDHQQLSNSGRLRVSSTSSSSSLVRAKLATPGRTVTSSPQKVVPSKDSHVVAALHRQRLLEQRKQRILGVPATTRPVLMVPSSTGEADATVSSITDGPDMDDLVSYDSANSLVTASEGRRDLANQEEHEMANSSRRGRLRNLIQAALPAVVSNRSSSEHNQRSFLGGTQTSLRSAYATDGEVSSVDGFPGMISVVEPTSTSTHPHRPTDLTLMRTTSHRIPSHKLNSYVDYDIARDRSAMDILLLLGRYQADKERGPIFTKNNTQQEQSDHGCPSLSLSRHWPLPSLCAGGADEAAEDDGPAGLSRSKGRTNPFSLLDFQDGDLLLDHFVDGVDWTNIAVDIADKVQQQMQRSAPEELSPSPSAETTPLTPDSQQELSRHVKRPAVHRSFFRGIEFDDGSKPSPQSRSESKTDDASIRLEDLFGHSSSSLYLLDSSAETVKTRPSDTFSRCASSLYLIESSPSSHNRRSVGDQHKASSTLQLLYGDNSSPSEQSAGSDSEARLEDSTSSFDQCFVVEQPSRSAGSSLSLSAVPRPVGGIGVEQAEPKLSLGSCVKQSEGINLSDSGRIRRMIRKSKFVKFDKVCIREYEMSIADNLPTCGVPVGLKWSYYPETVSDIIIYDSERRDREHGRTGYARSMSAKERSKLLVDGWGIRKSKVRKAKRKADVARAKRNETRLEEVEKSARSDVPGGKLGKFRFLPDVDGVSLPLPKG